MSCNQCWNPINWCESFDKFGHDDGDDCVHTRDVANALRKLNLTVEIAEDDMHNSVISSIRKTQPDGIEEQVFGDNVPQDTRPGYSDPREVLPEELISYLDKTFGKGEFFN